jgi:hypothetical protein
MNKKISELNQATVLTDADVLPIVNSAETKKVTVSTLKTNIRTGLALTTYVDSQDALKVDKIAGKGLSTEDFTSAEKTKLGTIATGAEVNVNADWNAVSGDEQILNKPTIATQTSQLTNNGADGTNPFITALDIPIYGQASTLVREVKNMTGATLTKGTVVYISGANGNKALVSKALATTDELSSRTFGLLQSNILNNGLGYCVIIGDLSGLDTSLFAEGDQLYLSGVTAGTYTATKILAPTHLVYVGKVTRSHPTQGQIEVGIQNGYELSEIHDVALTSVADKQLLSFDSATSLWKNKSVTTADIADSTGKRYQTDNQQSFNDATSSIQTQLDSKQSSLGYTPIKILVKDAVPKTVTNAVTQVISSSYLIPANTLSNNDFIRIVTAGLTRTGSGSVTFRIYINSVNSLSGANTIASSATISPTVTFAQITRNLIVSNNIIKNVLVNTPSDVQNTTVALTPITINNSVDQYILVALSSPISTDTITQEGLEITN